MKQQHIEEKMHEFLEVFTSLASIFSLISTIGVIDFIIKFSTGIVVSPVLACLIMLIIADIFSFIALYSSFYKMYVFSILTNCSAFVFSMFSFTWFADVIISDFNFGKLPFRWHTGTTIAACVFFLISSIFGCVLEKKKGTTPPISLSSSTRRLPPIPPTPSIPPPPAPSSTRLATAATPATPSMDSVVEMVAAAPSSLENDDAAPSAIVVSSP